MSASGTRSAYSAPSFWYEKNSTRGLPPRLLLFIILLLFLRFLLRSGQIERAPGPAGQEQENQRKEACSAAHDGNDSFHGHVQQDEGCLPAVSPGSAAPS